MNTDKTEPWEALQRRWSWQDLFGNATRDQLVISSQARKELEFLMWRDLSTEYDARHFEDFVLQQNIDITDEFWDLCSAWKYDEQQHYDALKRIVSLLYDVPEAAVDARMLEQIPDFSAIASFFTEEFRILILLAFDEVISAQGYLDDVPMYDSFGPKGITEWVKNASKDEAVHARNALTLIRYRHAHRIPEVPGVVDEILDYLLKGKNGYRGTFVLDDDYDEVSFRMAADSVCGFFSRNS
jgi:hypothetical protein